MPGRDPAPAPADPAGGPDGAVPLCLAARFRTEIRLPPVHQHDHRAQVLRSQADPRHAGGEQAGHRLRQAHRLRREEHRRY